jgi:subtilisin family serine protease
MKLFHVWFLLACILVSKVQSLEELSEDDKETLTNLWAVELDSNDESLAQEVAKKHGYKYGGRIGSLPNHFLLTREEHESKRGDIAYPSLREHPNVKWHEQQRTLALEKRGFLDGEPVHSSQERFTARELKDMKYFNDPEFSKQWYIASYGQNNEPKGSDMGILEAWKMGYTGKGIKVTVMDDGLDHTHPDLKHNYDPQASRDLNDNDGDPKPRDKPDQYHGTKCSGEIGAEGNNSICGVGLAPHVNLGGIRMLDGKVTGITEAAAFGLRPDYIDIFSASWGPKDNGQTMAGPSTLGKKALEHGVTNGRNGETSILILRLF